MCAGHVISPEKKTRNIREKNSVKKFSLGHEFQVAVEHLDGKVGLELRRTVRSGDPEM